MATRKYSNRIKHRPKHKKLRLRKNVRGFRRDEYYRLRTFNDGYDYPSKYLAER